MNDKQTDFPAFPNHPNTHDEICGMTLRDYFAAKAMHGIINNDPKGGETPSGVIARYAYELADAMLEARAL